MDKEKKLMKYKAPPEGVIGINYRDEFHDETTKRHLSYLHRKKKQKQKET